MSFAPKTINKNLKLSSSYNDPNAVFFPFIKDKIKYEGPKSINPLSFKYYNESELIMGKTMAEWCRFSVCFWHTFRGNGADPLDFQPLKDLGMMNLIH